MCAIYSLVIWEEREKEPEFLEIVIKKILGFCQYSFHAANKRVKDAL